MPVSSRALMADQPYERFVRDVTLFAVFDGTSHLMLTDLIMPEKDGIQTILELRVIDPFVPVIAMSGGIAAGGGDFLPLARQLGAKAVLSKPFEYRTFMESVRGALGVAA